MKEQIFKSPWSYRNSVFSAPDLPHHTENLFLSPQPRQPAIPTPEAASPSLGSKLGAPP